MFIDIHAHVYRVKAKIPGITEFCDPKELLKRYDELKIDCGVLLPIVCSVFPSGELMVICVSACLAGAVAGDHCSPISDTTIMASTGAQCEHINHVSTQLPYTLVAAAVSFAGFVLAGIIQNALIVLPICLVVLFVVLLAIRHFQKKTVN